MIDFKLMEHQKKVVEAAKTLQDVFICFETGTGKTCTVIQILRNRCKEEGRLLKILVVAPLITLRNWKEEFKKFSKFPEDAIKVTRGTTRARAFQIKKLQGAGGIVVTNYESFDSKVFFEAVVEWKPDILVCDEAHYLKNVKGKRAKKIAIISDLCMNKYLLTGTPILNNLLDIFMPFRILDGNRRAPTFGKNYFAFLHKYFEDKNIRRVGKKGYFPNWQPRLTTYGQLKKRMEKKMFVVKKKDVLDLPPVVEENVYVTMTEEQRKVYNQIKKEFVVFVDDLLNRGEKNVVVARLAVTKALRMQQVASGFVKMENGDILSFKNNPKIKALREILENLVHAHKVIVWCVFKENYRQIGELLTEMGIKYAEVHGNVKTQEKYKAVKEFNEDPETRVLIANPASAGVGINLVAASYSIYFSKSFKLQDEIQSEARNVRKGSEIHEKITKINILAEDTIDERIQEALSKKLSLSEMMLSFKS